MIFVEILYTKILKIQLFDQRTVLTSNCTVPRALSFSRIVTATTFPGILMLGFATLLPVGATSSTLVRFTKKVSDASGMASCNENLKWFHFQHFKGEKKEQNQ
jgi:hypothetical protein